MLIQKVWILLAFQYHLLRNISCLKCFSCSYFEGNPCPTNTTSITEWQENIFSNQTSGCGLRSSTFMSNSRAQDKTKYSSIGIGNDMACSVGYSLTGKVYLQDSVSFAMCNSTAYHTNIIVRINSIPEAGSEVTCCSADGCNWNGTTAVQGKSYADITGVWYILPDGFSWVSVIAVLVFIFILLLLCCGLCCFFCHRKKKKEKAMAGLQGKANPINPYINLNIQQSLDPSLRTPNQVNVLEIQDKNRRKLSSRDQERYSAVDRKLYNRELKFTPEGKRPPDDTIIVRKKDRIGAISKDIFSNDDFKLANMAIVDANSKKNEKQDWVHFWSRGNEAKPTLAKSSETNAFHFKK